MTVKTYDEKSFELAEHFLADDPTLNTNDKCHHLALAIQQAVEDWIETEHLREASEKSDLYSPTVKRAMKKFNAELDKRRAR